MKLHRPAADALDTEALRDMGTILSALASNRPRSASGSTDSYGGSHEIRIDSGRSGGASNEYCHHQDEGHRSLSQARPRGETDRRDDAGSGFRCALSVGEPAGGVPRDGAPTVGRGDRCPHAIHGGGDPRNGSVRAVGRGVPRQGARTSRRTVPAGRAGRVRVLTTAHRRDRRRAATCTGPVLSGPHVVAGRSTSRRPRPRHRVAQR